MVKIVISDQIPEHGLALAEDIIAKEQVIGFLPLTIEEGIVIVSFEAFNHISGMTCPLVDLAVCFHSVDQLRTPILNSNSITVVVVHMSE